MANENFYEKYVTEILTKANLTEENGKVDKDYAKKLAVELEKKMGLMIFDELNQTDLDEYTKLVDKKATAEQLGDFFANHIRNYDQKRQKVLEDFAYGVLQRTASIRQSLNS